MGCRCCRMIKSYMYDPSVPVDVHSRRSHIHNVINQQQPAEIDNSRTIQKFNKSDLIYHKDEMEKAVRSTENEKNQINHVHIISINGQLCCGREELDLKTSTSDKGMYIIETEESQKSAISNNIGPTNYSPMGNFPLNSSNTIQPAQSDHLEIQECEMQMAPTGFQTNAKEASDGSIQEKNNISSCNFQIKLKNILTESDFDARNCHSNVHDFLDDKIDAKSDISYTSEEANTGIASIYSEDTKLGQNEADGEDPVSSIAVYEESDGEAGLPGHYDSIIDSEVAEALAALDAATAEEDDEWK